MKNEARLATKAQADAVRQYLETLGCSLTHVQALEVLARGQGMRSRHLLGRGRSDALAKKSTPRIVDGAQLPNRRWTRVCFSYTDGSNCKRSSSMTFRGRLHRDQLQFIVDKLDDGLYFVPAQIGFESLHFAFSDSGGDDHSWHKMEMADPQAWVLDSEGYVLDAGAVQQVGEEAAPYATDADCDNLFWRFCRLKDWDEETQSDALWKHVASFAKDSEVESPVEPLLAWLQEACPQADDEAVESLAEVLSQLGFVPKAGVACEANRPVGSNAYQFVIVSPSAIKGAMEANFDVSTHQGQSLTHAPVMTVSAAQDCWALLSQMQEQVRGVRFMPEAYDPRYE